jgi:hypothetical protein
VRPYSKYTCRIAAHVEGTTVSVAALALVDDVQQAVRPIHGAVEAMPGSPVSTWAR